MHHYALLFGMGADAVCPYLCYQALFKARDQGLLGLNYTDAELQVTPLGPLGSSSSQPRILKP